MTYSEFWLNYLRAHDRAGTRLMHYLIGSTGALMLLIIAAITQYLWFILLAVVVGYAFA